MMRRARRAMAPWSTAMLVVIALFPSLAGAAEIDGATLSPLWGVPFAGVLLSIALFPLLAPHFWHRHYGKVATAWGALFLVMTFLFFHV